MWQGGVSWSVPCILYISPCTLSLQGRLFAFNSILESLGCAGEKRKKIHIFILNFYEMLPSPPSEECDVLSLLEVLEIDVIPFVPMREPF